jgi:hypothetical protein
MNHLSVRRSSVALAGFAVLTFVAACQDKRVKEVDTGITRDSALSILSQDVRGTQPDSFPNVYKRARYLINGKNYEVLFYTPNNEKQGKDSVVSKKLTPIVFVENKVVGKGWTYWDSVSSANHIPLEKHN